MLFLPSLLLSQQSQPQKKILIVDDSEAIVECLQEFFSQEGFAVQTSPGGEVLKVAARSQPDLILLDLVMPGLSGVSLSQLLKANLATGHIPIILVSARSRVSPSQTNSVDAFIRKPFDLQELLDTVTVLIGKFPTGPSNN